MFISYWICIYHIYTLSFIYICKYNIFIICIHYLYIHTIYTYIVVYVYCTIYIYIIYIYIVCIYYLLINNNVFIVNVFAYIKIYKYIYIYSLFYYEELAHTIMEAKSHNLLSAWWRPRKASGIIWLESEGLRTRGADGINLSPRAGEDEKRCPRSISEAGKKRGASSFFCLWFCSGPKQTGWCPPSLQRDIYWVYQFTS